MRRRLLLGGNNYDNYVFSASTTSRSVSNEGATVSINIASTADGQNIGYTVVSYETPITSVTTAATYVLIRYTANYTPLQRSGTVVLKQNDSNKTIEITLTQAALIPKIASGETCVIVSDDYYRRAAVGLNVASDGIVTSKPDWVNVTCDRGHVSVTATSSNSSSSTRMGNVTISIETYTVSFYVAQFPNGYTTSKAYETIGGINWSVKAVSFYDKFGDSTMYEYGAGSNYRTDDYYHSTCYTGQENPLASSADTATQVMGSGWRMPTSGECQTLIDNTTYYWSNYGGQAINGTVYYNNIGGLFVTNDGKALYLPTGESGWGSLMHDYGAIWTSTPYSTRYAYCLSFKKDGHQVEALHRQSGFSILGVYN